ncbi:MAG: trehalose-phosphatase, partial [Chitinophagaceae bacterium]|nr:trehalose-phosphatase [Rubrivivax sp.]
HHLRPLQLCAAGVQGAQRRRADGQVVQHAQPEGGGLEDATARLQALVAQHPRLRLELKTGSIALHYRQAPELEDWCLATMEHALTLTDDMTLLRGKMVVELKPRRVGKGLAVRHFLDEAPFQHRSPWFFGDDVTDEAAFDVVQSLGGVAVKVGEGDTLAAHRLPDPTAVRAWMAAAHATLRPPQSKQGV